MEFSAEHLRLFIALPVPASVKDQLGRLQSELRKSLPGAPVRWTKPEQFHLTLKFLGNVAAHRTGELVEATTTACASLAPLRLRSGGIGFFPHARSPRVIWSGVNDDQNKLPGLASALDTVARRFGEPTEAGFAGHLTLGRAGKLEPTHVRRLMAWTAAMENRTFGEWTANAVQIIRSDLSAAGARHSIMADIPLKGPGPEATA